MASVRRRAADTGAPAGVRASAPRPTPAAAVGGDHGGGGAGGGERAVSTGGIKDRSPSPARNTIARNTVVPHYVSTLTPLRDLCRNKVLGKMVLGDEGEGWRVLVLDREATRVISSLVGMYDITEKNIMVVEDLHKLRQDFPQLDAIYLMEPNVESIKLAAEDFASERGAIYRRAHLLFLSTVPGDIMEMFRTGAGNTAALKARIGTFREVHLNFLVPESQTFHLDMGGGHKGEAKTAVNAAIEESKGEQAVGVVGAAAGETAPAAPTTKMQEAIAAAKAAEMKAKAADEQRLVSLGPMLYKELYTSTAEETPALTQAAEKLVTLCATLGEFPHVRYSRTSPRTSELATIFQARMQDFIGANADFEYAGQSGTDGKGRGTLLILDRSDDPLSPLMHDFTYQCLVEDLLKIQDGVLVLGGKDTKPIVLNEMDVLWTEFRNEYFGYAQDEIAKRFRELVAQHPQVAALMKGQSKNISVKEMAKATGKLPEFQELSRKLSQHIDVAAEVMDKVVKTGLLDAGSLEQTMATGTDEVGKNRSRKELVQGFDMGGGVRQAGLMELLSSNITPQDTKLRLLCIFTITQKGLTTNERDLLTEAANLTPQQMHALDSLAYLGVNVSEPKGSDSRKSAFEGWSNNLMVGLGLKGNEQQVEDSKASHMRYSSPLYETLKELLTDTMSIDEYPSVLPLPSKPGSGSASARSTAGKGAVRRPSSTTAASNDRTVVFVLGGLCYQEKRVAYQAARECQRDVIIGGTSMLAPQAYLHNLKYMDSI